jgi:Protein of unknown function (DUF2846)
MKNWAWGVTLFFIAVSALAAMPSDNGNGNAIVYVYRPHRFTAAAKNPSIYVDGREISRLHNGTYLKFEVAPGQHSLTSASYVEGDPFESFQAGREYFFRLQTGSWVKGAVGRAEMKLLAVPKEQGTVEIEKLKEGRVAQPSKP